MGTDRGAAAPRVTRRASPAAILVDTHLGWVCAAAQDGALVRTCLPVSTAEAAARACGVGADLGRRDELLDAVERDLRRYFDGKSVDLARYPVELSHLPPFYQRALRAAGRIPHGEVRSYGWVATEAGRPRAARAAGGAMSRNPIPLLIPCHRVVPSGGGLGGFGGGPEMKRALLTLEGVRFDRRSRISG